MTSPIFLAFLLSQVITSAVAQPPTATAISPSSEAAPSPTSWPAPPEPPNLIGWEVGQGPWTTAADGSSRRENLYIPFTCPPSSTFTVSEIYAACCSGPCVIPKNCIAVIVEDVDNGTVALSSIASGSSQLNCQYVNSIPPSACQTIRLYPTPYQQGTTFSYVISTQMVGCVATSSSPATATALFRFSDNPPPVPHSYIHNNDHPLDTKHKVMIGVVVPVVIIMIGLTAVFIDRWRERGQSTRSLMRSTLADLATTDDTPTPPLTQTLPIYEGMKKVPRAKEKEVKPPKESKPPKKPKPAADVEGADRARRLEAAMAGPAKRRGRDVGNEGGRK